MNKLYAFFRGSWENIVLFLALVVLLLTAAWAWRRLTELPHFHEQFSDLPAMPEDYDWGVPQEQYFQPRLPGTVAQNPFKVFLKAKELPPPPPPKVVTPPPPPLPPPPPPAKTVQKYILKYCGSYSTTQDELFVILEASCDGKTERKYLRIGEKWLDKFTVTAHQPQQITVEATNGKTEDIPWNHTAEFLY